MKLTDILSRRGGGATLRGLIGLGALAALSVGATDLMMALDGSLTAHGDAIRLKLTAMKEGWVHQYCIGIPNGGTPTNGTAAIQMVDPHAPDPADSVAYRELGVDVDGRCPNRVAKMLFILHEPAFENWKAFARAFFTRKNRYTGRSLAEEPAMPLVSLVNEGMRHTD